MNTVKYFKIQYVCMQVNLPDDTVDRCKSLMNKKETWGAFIERILDENEENSLRARGL